jgi:hypothetical protein
LRGPADVAPAQPGESEHHEQDNFDEGDAGGPASKLPHVAGSDAGDGASNVIAGEVESGGRGAATGGGGHAQKAGGSGLRNEDAAAEQAESRNDDDPEIVAKGDGFAGKANGDGHGDTAAHADAGDEVSAKGRDDEADKVDGKKVAECEGGEVEGRIGEIEGAVGEGRHEGEEGSEAESEGGEQARVAEVAESDPEAGRGFKGGQGWARAFRREPARDENGAEEGEHAEENEAPAPAERVGNEAGEEAPEESAERGGADVETHDESDGFAAPLFADVGDDGGEDAGESETLEETPDDECMEARRGCGECGGGGEDEDGDDDDALAAEALGKRAEDGAASATPRVEALTVRPTAALEAWKSVASMGSRGCVE